MYKMKNGKDVSEETVDLALQAHFKANPEPKPKFEPIDIHHGCFEVGVDTGHVTIKCTPPIDGICRQNSSAVDKFISALQSAKAFAIANKIE